jgi:hypothetical protein
MAHLHSWSAKERFPIWQKLDKLNVFRQLSQEQK